jgi:hypothetical protein
MPSLEDIKHDLPEWPDDVIDQWLLNLARRPDLGWPPPDPFGFSSWKYILDSKPLTWWSNVVWQLQTIDCSFDNLAIGTKRIVIEMSSAHLNGANNIYGAMVDSRERFGRALQYIMQYGSFPRALVGMRIASGLSVLDGNHRIAAHFVTQSMASDDLERRGLRRPSQAQRVWMGTYCGGKVTGD